MKLAKIEYAALNSRQKENYNFQKIAAILADYGFNSIRLTDDWEGADFIAIHIDGETSLKVQLKGRVSFYIKYFGKSIYICFRDNKNWYLYPHDEVLEQLKKQGKITNTKSWIELGGYSSPRLSEAMMDLLDKYRL